MKNKGIAITILAAVFWGFSGACAQYIFDTFHADPVHLTAIRISCAGVALTLFGMLKDPDNMKSIWKDRPMVIRLFIFGIAGLMFCQITYMLAISYTNSGTATILQYIGPVLVMIVSCLMARRLPRGKEVVAIFLVIVGTFIIATHGNIHNMVLTPAGLFWGLMSAVSLMTYTLIPVKLTEKYGPISASGWGMIIGGIVLCLGSRVWEMEVIYDFRFVLAFIGIVIFGTILPFTMYVYGVSRCGAVKASMIASIEPVSATVFMVVWLKEPFMLIDLAGFLCIFITVFLLVKKEEVRDPEKPVSTCEPHENKAQ